MDGYLIPTDTVRTELLIANSRFISAAAPAESVDAARAFIASIRAEFPDANHHVYAYRIGSPPSVIDGMSDDGEPSGTSGPPSLAVLRGTGIGDVVLVTTRYFGGTKLGTGGLTRAYSEAARTVLAALPITRKIAQSRLLFDLPYPLYELVKRMLPMHDAVIEDESFGAAITLLIRLPTAHAAAFTAALIELSSGAVVAEPYDP